MGGKNHFIKPSSAKFRVAMLLGRRGERKLTALRTDWEPVDMKELWDEVTRAYSGAESAQAHAIRAMPESRPATAWSLRVGRSIYRFESMSFAIISEVTKTAVAREFLPLDLWSSERFLKGVGEELASKREVARDPASALFDALLLVKHGNDFDTYMHGGSRRASLKSASSSKGAALKLLRDPRRQVLEINELASLDNGKVVLKIVLGGGGGTNAASWIEFVAPPLKVLKTQCDMRRDIPIPETLKKTMKTRTDTI
jgi:hypothetical protein